jgi:hypothetical protein
MKAMNMKPIKNSFLTLVILALGLTAFSGATATAGAVDARFLSDKPVVTYLFHHTAEKPYDIKCLSWYGGIMERIMLQNKSGRMITVDFKVKKLSNGVVAVPARRSAFDKTCAPGKSVVLLDMLSKDGDASLAYNFSHELKTDGLMAGKSVRNDQLIAAK